MKYYQHVIDPANANMNHWQLHKSNGFTFILPKADHNFDRNYSILFQEHKKENIVIISPSPMAQHGQQLNVLFKYLKLPKETKHLDCLLGTHFARHENLSWGRTVAPNPENILYDISNKNLIVNPKELTPKELLLTTYIEKTFSNYLKYAKKIYDIFEKTDRLIKFDIKEIIPKPILKKEAKPKIKSPQRVKLKLPIRKLK
ncbi:MAG: hypothetical protein WCX82_03195 [archaeon]|jgi:hypothetical protein